MLTTRCPACRTAFRISQAQMEARGGKVRCGRCTAVFDARESLREDAEAAVRPGVEPSVSEPPARAAMPISKAHADAPGTPRKPAAGTVPKAPLATSPAGRPDEARGGLARSPLSPRTRPSEWIAAALLLVVLAGQMAFHYRGEIALLVPELKPQIKSLCDTLGCEVPLPRRAELMSIESSDLQADTVNPAVMVLSATLRNRAAFPQSLPALELTLTDMQDQPLARRVLLARDYLGRATNADAGFAANSEVPVKVFIEAASLGAAGYRLYLFYP